MKDWYSHKATNRFSREHRAQLPAGARMVDLDGVLYAPYIRGTYGGPLMLVEFKPEDAREDFWLVTRQLSKLAGIPAARVVEQKNGRYTVHVTDDAKAENGTGFEVREVGRDLTVQDWYRLVEEPLRELAGHRRAA